MSGGNLHTISHLAMVLPGLGLLDHTPPAWGRCIGWRDSDLGVRGLAWESQFVEGLPVHGSHHRTAAHGVSFCRDDSSASRMRQLNCHSAATIAAIAPPAFLSSASLALCHVHAQQCAAQGRLGAFVGCDSARPEGRLAGGRRGREGDCSRGVHGPASDRTSAQRQPRGKHRAGGRRE